MGEGKWAGNPAEPPPKTFRPPNRNHPYTTHLSTPILFLFAVVVTPTDYLQAGTPLIRGLKGLHRTGILPRHVPVGILYRYNTGTALHSEHFVVYLRLHEALHNRKKRSKTKTRRCSINRN